jgi:protein-S-isoprenylcysteine O-methyltransferase Ste14
VSPDPSKPLARVKLHPFVIVTGAVVVSSLGRSIWRLDLDQPVVATLRICGGVSMVVGGLMLIVAYRSMARARTTINPRLPTTKIVSTGVFRISRNPIYLGWFLVIVGVGLANASLFQIAVAVVMIGLLHWAVVLPEERYLEKTFGDEYVRYKEKVRRWL